MRAMRLLAASWLCLAASAALAYAPAGRWATTATNVSTGGVGTSATLTWSIAPDGTWIAEEQASSNLVATLDSIWGAGSGGTNYTARPWFPYVSAAFERWGELGGVEFRYEPQDDGHVVDNTRAQLGVRGDIRLTGTQLDGPLGTLAYNEFPGSGGDMVLDTSDTQYFGNSADNYLRFRNNMMHELGHALGLAHVRSSDAGFLLESSASIAFDGPQLDDVLGLHHLYGDAVERWNDGAGNDTLVNAMPLGQFRPGDAVSYGLDSLLGTYVDSSALGFLSVSNREDKDVYSFSIDQPANVDLLMVPGGATYQYNNTDALDSTSTANLQLELLDESGNVVALLDGAARGQAELHRNLYLASPGEYYLRVTGDHYLAQFYALHLAVNAPTVGNPVGDYSRDGVVDLADRTVWRDQLGTEAENSPADGSSNGTVTEFDHALWSSNYGAGLLTALPGDFNLDGAVDLQDYSMWRDSVGALGFALPADADRNYRVNQADYALWQANFGRRWGAAGQFALAAVPEPGAVGLLLLAMFAALWRIRGAASPASQAP